MAWHIDMYALLQNKARLERGERVDDVDTETREHRDNRPAYQEVRGKMDYRRYGNNLQGGSEGITQAVLRRRQASQGRFLRLRGCLARPNWLWIVNLRGRPDANTDAGSAPLCMACLASI